MKALGKFEIQDRLGQGAMGVVYKARDPRIGRSVALKTITTGLAEDPALLERFYHEAQSAGALQHPNIVTIYEMGEADNIPFIAMEYLSGESLDKLIEARRTLPLSQKVGYVAYVCRALAYAHKQGVVHRDVKPANVMVTTEGTVKVVDFGIARIAENSKSQTGLVIGTLAYMSPQQIEGGRAEARSDIFAAGVLFYELLAYRRPFDGENYGALMLNIMTQPAPPLSQTAPGTPPEVEAVLERMLRKNIEERFQSMEEVLIELEPVWRSLQRTEVADLLVASRTMLKAGDTAKAFETVRRVLQIDSAHAEAKTLLDQVNAEIRKNKGGAPHVAEKAPTGDETLVGSTLSELRASTSSIPALTASRAQSASKAAASTQQTNAQSAVASPSLSATEPAQATVQPAAKNWMGIAAVVLVVVIGGGAASFFLLRAKGPAVPGANPDANVAQATNASNAGSAVANNAPAANASPAPASGSAPSKQSPPVPSSSNVANKLSTTAQARPNTAPPQQPQKGQAPAPQATNPAPGGRTEMALNNAPAPPVPSQPVAANPQPVAPKPVAPTPAPAVPTPAPVAVAAAPTPAPAPKAAEPAAPAKAEPAPVSAPSETNVDRQAIIVSLQQLSAAFSHRNIGEVEELWPKGNKNTLNALKTVFGSVKSMNREFHPQSVNISPDGISATAIGTYEGKFVNAQGVDTANNGNFYVRFKKLNGRWFIDDASF